MQVKGCGCRYRINDAVQPHQEHCEYLCDKHKERFILEKYNADILLNKLMEEDAEAMEQMRKEQQEMNKNNNNNNNNNS